MTNHMMLTVLLTTNRINAIKQVGKTCNHMMLMISQTHMAKHEP